MKQIKHIIFDADDTLWENNIYYLKAANDFYNLAEKQGVNRSQVEKAFDELEIKVVKELGYGSFNFIFILKELFKQFELSNKLNHKELNFIIDEFNSHKLKKPKLFEHVADLMRQLSDKYELYILTKGDQQEQLSLIHI